MQAPSEITKPSRKASKGLEASVGRWLKEVARALILDRPASTRGSMDASVLPQIMASASPPRMKRKASPME